MQTRQCLCGRAQGSDGDKDLSNGMLELKANCDSRLLARALYKNSYDKILVLLIEEKTYPQIPKICRTQVVKFEKSEDLVKERS